MIRSVVVPSAVGWPSLAVLAVMVGQALRGVSHAVEVSPESVNAWDVIVPTLGNIQLLGILVAVVWLPTAVLSHREISREDVVLRWGSWARVTRRLVLVDFVRAFTSVVVVCAAVMATAAPLGLDPAWSDHTLGVLEDGGLDTEVSATAAAMRVSSPWVFVVTQGAWAVGGLLAYAALHLVAVLWRGPQVGAALAAVVGLLAVVTSSGFFGFRPFFDLSGWTNGLWAATRSGVVIGVLTAWAVLAVLLRAVVVVRDRDRLPAAMDRALPWLALAASLVSLALYSVRGRGESAQGVDLVGAAFAGQYGSLVGFIVSLAPLTVVAGMGVQRLAAGVDTGLTIVVLRHGSSLRWLLREVAWSTSAVLAVAAIAVASLAALGVLLGETGHVERSAVQWLLLVSGYGGAGVLLYLLAAALLWWRGDVAGWPVAVLLGVLVSYPFFTRPIPDHPLAAFSIQPGMAVGGSPFLTGGSAACLLLVLIVAVLRRPLPPLS